MDYHGFFMEYLDSVWANRNPEAVAAFYAPDALIDGLGSDESLTTQDLIIYTGMFLALVEVPRWEILRMIVQGDQAAYLIRGDAVSRRSGAPITITGQVILTIKDGLITEAYNSFDLMAFFAELGVIPDNFLEQVLSGTVAA